MTYCYYYLLLLLFLFFTIIKDEKSLKSSEAEIQRKSMRNREVFFMI